MTGPPDDVPKSPWKFNVTEGAGNQIEQMRNGSFMAYWNGRVVYQNRRIKRFETSADALAFLARCDAAGKIIR
jgi:hypothetical protein